MKRLAALLLALVPLAAGAQTIQKTPQVKTELRLLLEPSVRGDFEAALKTLEAKIKPGMPENEVKMAKEGLQSLSYNKAYNHYRCYLEHAPSVEKGDECIQERVKHFLVYNNLTRDYFSSVAGRTKQCEMQSRLFEAEIEFPPYSFLKGAHLFDFQHMNECLRR
jgi:hypothetical protein